MVQCSHYVRGFPNGDHASILFLSTVDPNSGQSIYVTYNDGDPNWANGNVYTYQNVNQELATATTPSGAGSGTVTSRSFISFDLTALPANAEIVSARLSLFGLPSYYTIPQGNQGANNLLIQRVLGDWNQTTVTWNTQPATTTSGQVELPQTSATFNFDVINVDVTQLVQDMRNLTPGKLPAFVYVLKRKQRGGR